MILGGQLELINLQLKPNNKLSYYFNKLNCQQAGALDDNYKHFLN